MLFLSVLALISHNPLLQDELRRLKRRILTCCGRSDAASIAARKENLQEDLKKLLTSPEGLVLLGAAAAHSAYSLEKSPSNAPQFNDSEIRAWASTAFLDKDDFEKAIANITKYFHEGMSNIFPFSSHSYHVCTTLNCPLLFLCRA